MEAYFFLHDGREIAAARHRNNISGGCAPAHALPLLQPSLNSQANAAVPLHTNTEPGAHDGDERLKRGGARNSTPGFTPRVTAC